MPDLKALMISGLPTTTAIVSPCWLAEMTSQFSYPLNSENARPPGTLRVYLSWLCLAEIAAPKTTARKAATLPLISMRVSFISVAPDGVDEAEQAIGGRGCAIHKTAVGERFLVSEAREYLAFHCCWLSDARAARSGPR